MPFFSFIVEADKPLVRIPRKVMNELAEHRAALSDYAGKRIRVVDVYTRDDESDVPQELARVIGTYLEFDEKGLLPADIRQQWAEAAMHKLGKAFPGKADDSNVVPLEQRIKERELDRKHEWTPTPEELTLIADAALGHPRAIKAVASVKLKKPPSPRISYETSAAFDEIRKALSGIYMARYRLDERELMGLQQMIDNALAEGKLDHPHIWRAVTVENADALKLMEAKRTGLGEWVAAIDLIKWSEKEEGETVHGWHLKCPTRADAIDAAKRLAREHIDKLGANMTFEARVVSALEWED